MEGKESDYCPIVGLFVIIVSDLLRSTAKTRLVFAPPPQTVVPNYQPLDPLPEQPDLVGLAEHRPSQGKVGHQADPISTITWPRSR